MSSEDNEMISMFDRLPSWKKAKMMKVLDLILNDTKRAQHLLDLYESGQISNNELWQLV